MAINPNTDFTTRQVLTADQANRWPRGIVAFAENISTSPAITGESVQITGTSFTAVANRYYKVTYYEADVNAGTTTSYAISRIRMTNISGSIKQTGYTQLPTASTTNAIMNLVWVGTLSAGVTNFVGTQQTQTGTSFASRSADLRSFLMVEDIGPA